jgi:hypothetical protein
MSRHVNKVASLQSRLHAATVAAALALSSPSARADDVTSARAHFADGVKLFQAGDYEGARRKFLDADREHHAPVILYNVARAEERLEHPQAAVDAYEKYLGEDPKGEYAQAATVAIAQIKARSCRLRVESDPPGVRVFVNGEAAPEPTPTQLLVRAGREHVVVEGDGWRAEREIDATPGGSETVSLARPAASGPEHDQPASAAPASAPAPDRPATPELAHEPDGLVFGAAFVVVPYFFFDAENRGPNSTHTTGADAGLRLEVGYAFTPRAEILLRALGALGSECPGFFDSHFAGVGPALSFRVSELMWVGASLLGGQARTCRPDASNVGGNVVFSTDIVFSPSFDLSFSIANKSYGQWLVSLSVAYYFANPSQDNRVVYAPIGFGAHFF